MRQFALRHFFLLISTTTVSTLSLVSVQPILFINEEKFLDSDEVANGAKKAHQTDQNIYLPWENNLLNELSFQAHVPCYALVWFNPVISPVIYVAFNLQYRQA